MVDYNNEIFNEIFTMINGDDQKQLPKTCIQSECTKHITMKKYQWYQL